MVRRAPDNVELAALTRAELDISDSAAVMTSIRSHEPELIINAGAYTAVDRADAEPSAAESANATGPLNLALAAEKTGARLIHLSTDYVFDGTASRPYATDASPNPLNTYGRTKLAGEKAVTRTLPTRSIILRTAWVYSAEGSNFVRTMLRLMKANGTVRVVSDQVGTPTSTHSLAQTIWALASRSELRGTFHWTDSGVASWYDFAVAIAEESAAIGLLPSKVEVLPIATEDYPTPAKRPSYSVLDKRSLLAEMSLPLQHWRCNLRAVLNEISNA